MFDFERSRDIFLKIYDNPQLAHKLEEYIEAHKTKFKIFLKLCHGNRWEPLLSQKPIVKLCLVYAFLPTVFDRYCEKGIPENIFWDTMSDIKIWIIDHRDRTGEDGLFELHWIMHHMNMNLFKIGRLQYQKLFWYFKAPYECDGVKFSFGDKVINMHIPRGEKCDIEACKKSIEMAKDFFAEFFSDFPNDKYMCHSWMLYPHNRDFMRADGNIVRFGEMFNIVEEKESPQQTYLWLYGVKINNSVLMKNKKSTGSYGCTENLPQNTSLQKSTIDYIKNGGIFGEGLGVIVLK